MNDFMVPVLIVTGIGILAGVILSAAAKFMAVKVDERFEKIRAELPGANCGACGYAGCDQYAQALVENPDLATNLCVPGGAGAAKALSEIMGVSFEATVPNYAVVHCNGTCNNTQYAVDYEGPATCAACSTLFGGRGTCPNACLGFGDCVKVCPYGAIDLVDGVAVVDKNLCVGCGLCAKTCPKALISLIPVTSNVYVRCSSQEKGAATRKACKTGCIACRKCEKACPSQAITIVNNHAVIDPAKCTNCGTCVAQCPTGAIHEYKCPGELAAQAKAEAAGEEKAAE